MTKSRTRKTTSAPPTQKAEPEQTAPMDPGAPEQSTPSIHRAAPRDCYAIQTLVREVLDLFPEVTYETSGTNAFNTNLVVAFHDGETPDLYPLLVLVGSDHRVLSADRDSMENYAVVEFRSDLRTQDLRDSFGLAEAHQILHEGAQGSLTVAVGDAMDTDEDFLASEDDS